MSEPGTGLLKMSMYITLVNMAKDSGSNVDHTIRMLNDMYVNDPEIPEAMRTWIKMGGYADMGLAEFVAMVDRGGQ